MSNQNNQNFHPVQHEPPVAHALHKFSGESKTLSYEYNGIDIITMHIPKSDEIGFRHGSDGTVQTVQYAQQIYITVEKSMTIELQFKLSDDAVNMRGSRAKEGQSIIAQMGSPLIEGVNGIYDRTWDLLITFHGCNWHWKEKSIVTKDGYSYATAVVEIGEKPLFINLFMHYYKKHLGFNYHTPWDWKPKQKAVSGWCSWEAFRRNISQTKISEAAQFMAENFKPYGLEYIQVDDGYQKMPLPVDPKMTMAEGWFSCVEEKFPDGHTGIIKSINNTGMKPGIWTNANITNKEFADYHGNSILWNGDKPLLGEWIDYLYNCKEETLETHVKPLFKSLKEVGYEYIKIDAIRHLLLDGLHEAVRLGHMSNTEAESKFRAYMLSTRQGMGQDVYYLASWGEMHEVVGVADACRISMDANPTWAGIRMQLFETARWFHTQRIVFLNDPDHVCVRTKSQWAKSVLSLISLSGELYMLSDSIDAYTEEKATIIRKTLPPLKSITAETGPLNMDFPAYTWTKLHGFAVHSTEYPIEAEEISLKEVYDMAGVYPTMEADHPFSSLWSIHIGHNDENWCVAGRFATVPLRASVLSLESLNLSPEKKYHAFDFWDEKYLGEVRKNIDVSALKTGCCQIFSLREAKETPQLIASTRHVSMDAISVKKTVWNENSFTLKLDGIIGSSEKYYVHTNGYGSLKNSSIDNGNMKITITGELIEMYISFNNQQTEIVLDF